jgi:transcriptional regulator of arginine metabolism
MNARKERQAHILKLITDYQISTQDELILHLTEDGVQVTQATISRDLKELKLVKKVGSDGKSYYSVGTTDRELHQERYNSILAGAILSVDSALNTCVVKTHVGMANAAGAALDALDFEGIVGTLAGDDTIFVLCRTEERAEAFCQELRERILA